MKLSRSAQLLIGLAFALGVVGLVVAALQVRPDIQ